MAKTFGAVNETDVILNKVKESISIISEYNAQAALKYVNAIQEILKERTRYAVQKINRIVMDKIREIENELTSFDYVITEASSGIVDYTLQDMKKLRESISLTTNATYRTDFENVFDGVQAKIASTFEDLDSMWTFYGSYMSDIIERKVQNATDSISMIVNSNRRYCKCTMKEKVNFCYTISAQNVKISVQLESLIKVFGIVNNTSDILDTLQPILLKNSDQHSCDLLAEARNVVNKALVKSENVLKTALKDDDCFLGTAAQKSAYENHQNVKDFVLRSFETSIQSLAKNLNVTTSDFKVVQEKHRKEIEQDLTNALAAMSDEIRAKTKRLTNFTDLEEYVQRSSFSNMRLWMDTKFQNVTNVVNPMFEKRQNEIADDLKYTLQFIVSQQVPFISSLSVQNYLPIDICPLSTNYQKFVAATLDRYLDRTRGDVKTQLTTFADSTRESDTAQSIQDEIGDDNYEYNQVDLSSVQNIENVTHSDSDVISEQPALVEIMMTEMAEQDQPQNDENDEK